MSFLAELKRRNVFKVGIAYSITSWLLIQVADILLETIGAPAWVMQTLFVVLAVGLVIALFFAWAFELTPEGVKRESEVDRSQSITPQTGQKLNRTIIAILVMALGYFVIDKFYLSAQRVPVPAEIAVETTESSSEAEKQLQTIAVLPFVDMSADNDNEYFSDGLTEELLNILAKIRELRVAGRTSSFAFKGKNEDLRSIGEKLDVETILEGSVRKDNASNRVRITAQLINVEDGYHLWSETYDRDLVDIFAIQEEIARKVTEALRITLLGEDEANIAVQGASDISDYDLYLRGLQQLNIQSFAALEQAVEIFNKVLEKDPTYTPAKLGLVKAWFELAFTGAISRAEAVENTESLLSKVIEDEPDNSAAHELMARVFWAKDDNPGQERQLELALTNGPRNIDALTGMGRFIAYTRNHIEKGLEYLEEAERIDPYSADVIWDLLVFNAFIMQPEKAEPYADRIAEIQPDNPTRYWGPALAYQFNGQLATALGFLLKAAELDPNDYEMTAGIAATWLALGDPEQAEYWAKQADAIGADKPSPIMTRVMLYQYREQYGLAADMARRALERKPDNRLGSTNGLRRAYISEIVRQGEISEGIEYYQGALPGAFATPLDLDTLSPRQVDQLLDIALLLRKRDPESTRADELIRLAEQKLELWDERFLPWLRNLYLASISAAQDDKQTAISRLQQAYNTGLRMRWRSYLLSTAALNSLNEEPEFKELIARLESDMALQREEAYQIPGVLR